MDTIRAFIAIDLPPEIQASLQQVVLRLKKNIPSGVRWVQANHIHITLKFLGETPLSVIKRIILILPKISSKFHTFPISVGGLGAFPNPKRPRVIWIGINAPHMLMDIQKMVDIETVNLGCPGENRAFSPHLTLGRVQRYASQPELMDISNTLSSNRIGELGSFNAQGITLFQSILKSTGPEYVKQTKARFQNDSPSDMLE